MTPPDPEESPHPPVTELLIAWSGGDGEALDRLVPLIYGELERMARRRLRQERRGHTLDTRSLVHEAYLRLVDQQRADWRNRSQFLSVAAAMMRRVLVDHARRRQAARRGGNPVRITLGDTPDSTAAHKLEEILAVDEALERLEKLDARQGRTVTLRYFAGMTLEEIAGLLDVSLATVKRDWTVARAWLRRELRPESS